MQHLNVCLVNDSFPPAIDGVANAVVNYAGIIENSRGSATVVTPYYPGADDSVYPFRVVRYPSLDTTKLVGYRAGLPFHPEVMHRLEGGGFDIIHSHCPVTSTMLARALRDRIHAPIVFTYHTKFDIDIANAIRGRLLQEEAKAILAENISACDEVWTVSRGAGENLRKIGYQGAYTVMPNGVDFPRGRMEDAFIRRVTAGYDLPEGVPVFLFVGRMMWYKGIRIILDAMKLLSDAGKDFRMVFIGGGGDKAEILACADSLLLGSKVIFIEPIHDRDTIRAWYCRADLFIFPSTFDTNGLVVREAAACALPSVLIAGSCAAEDVSDGENGFLIPEDAASLAAKLRELLACPDAVHQAGEAAQKTLYMSWEESVSRACDRYGAVLEDYRLHTAPERRRFTDELIHAAGESMDAVMLAEEHARSLRNDLSLEAQRVKTQARIGLNEFSADVLGGIRRAGEIAEELCRFTDRFL